MSVRPTLGDIATVTLIGGWARGDNYVVGEENSLLVRCRAQSGIQVSRERDSNDYFTIDAGQAQVIPCMNSVGEVIFFRGPAGAVVEIWRQNDV